jgi:hypothetical protein
VFLSLAAFVDPYTSILKESSETIKEYTKYFEGKRVTWDDFDGENPFQVGLE